MTRASAGTSRPKIEPEVEVKTKFPVARIKRIMQADEEIGKVAQVTPVAVCKLIPLSLPSRGIPLSELTTYPLSLAKALELFMISLVSTAAEEAKAGSSKRVTSAHLKRVVEKDPRLDFLRDIMSKVQDAPAPSENTDEGNGSGEVKKPRKGGAKNKRKNSEAF